MAINNHRHLLPTNYYHFLKQLTLNNQKAINSVCYLQFLNVYVNYEIEKNRKQALERGVIINDLDGDYVPATINYNGSEIKVKLRLKGHMTDHLLSCK